MDIEVSVSRLVSEPKVRSGWYRVVWVCDLPKEEASSPVEAAQAALTEQLQCAAVLANPFYVIDGDSGAVSEHDLAS